MPEVSDDELDRLHAGFAQIEAEIRSGSIVTAAELAQTGQHNVDQLRDEEEE